MTQEFRSLNEMLAHLRHKDVVVEHKAVKVEDIIVEKPKEEKPKKGSKKGSKKKEDK